MKKCLLIFSFILFGFVSYGQFGLGISPAIVWDTSPDAISAFAVGGEINYQFTDLHEHVAIQPSLNYVLGVNSVLYYTTWFGSYWDHSHYVGLGIPIMYYLEENHEGLYLDFAPQLGVLLEPSWKLPDNYSRAQAGLGLGFGYDSGKLQIEFGFGIGLSGQYKRRSAGLGVTYLIDNLF